MHRTNAVCLAGPLLYFTVIRRSFVYSLTRWRTEYSTYLGRRADWPSDGPEDVMRVCKCYLMLA